MSSADRGAVVLAPKKARRQRFSRVANAAATIEGFDQDTDITFALTLGQFSLLDLIEATLDITGPADVVIATWSVGFYDLAAAERFRDCGKLRSCRFVMDSSGKRGQASGADVASVFGADAIRTTRTHAKFALIENELWHVVIQSSMNLNLNERSEQFSMTHCAETAGFVRAIVDELWSELPAGPIGPDFEAWCGQVARLRDAQRRIALEGLIVADAKGNPMAHPAIAIERQAQAELRAWGQTFRSVGSR